MCVDRQRRYGAAVTHHTGYRADVGAVGDLQGRIGVAELVRGHRPKTVLLRKAPQLDSRGSGDERSAVAFRKDPLCRLLLPVRFADLLFLFLPVGG